MRTPAWSIDTAVGADAWPSGDQVWSGQIPGLGGERVHTLAGSFYAVRIERWGSRGERVDTYWYSPRVRYWVRLESYANGYAEELVEFRISTS